MVAAWIIATLVAIAIQIISYVLMPKPKAPKPEAVKELEEPVAEAGIERPVIFGTMMIQSPNCLWYGDKYMHTYKVKA
ncbi:hypothetical protein [Novosphingobium resinovorum]|uniref:Uncharacterized protein n=1 Tax=Novosphingobium resinovorum TaxID=158500 RepID=A0A1D8A393_9SPHN|nr:hypothetical protein [Novosphingobium resinovorum]AOR76564.1 hypothetical protein BES08_07240 [Novosphingobium resinovorum]